MKAKFDVVRMQYLTRTCQKLRHIEMCGSGVIGDSLTASLPHAKNLEMIVLGTNCEISLSAVQLALKTCQKTLVGAIFLRVKGSRVGFLSNQWPELQSLGTLHLRSSGDVMLDEVRKRHLV